MKLFRMGWLKLAVLLLDTGGMFVSYLLAYELKFSGQIPEEEWASFLQYVPWLGLLTAVIYYFFNLYDFAGRRKPAVLLYNLVLAHLVFMAALIVVNYWLKSFSLPRSVVITAFMAQVTFTFGLRLLLFGIQAKGSGRRKTLVIVSGRPADLLMLEKLKQKGAPWLEITQVLTAAEQAGDSGGPLPGRGADHLHWGEAEVLMLGQGVPADVRSEWIREAGERGVEVLLIPDFYELYLAKAEAQQIDDLLVYSIMPPQLTLPERFLKRALDLVCSALLLLLACPLLLAAFLLVPATSRGRALYVQERLGRLGRPFRLLKFRSMIDNAEQATGPVLAGDGDSRITAVGRFMRSTRIDELPQLFNVLAGQMSLVGPRPERAFFIDQFKKELPYYTYRLMVKPGLTGLAQVMAGYTTSAADKLRYDLMYIKNYSLLLDLKLLFQTLLVVLSREQARGVRSGAGKEAAGLPGAGVRPAEDPASGAKGLLHRVSGSEPAPSLVQQGGLPVNAPEAVAGRK
ncbi:sugar transferase [Paenibacillus pinistramenti]|uniref:sugar transferase n=1 Tax=Paenibacillus pinistramenti TaxID=1768003 RepID=UPI001108C604|nr:sugar transferase [Paenibacillus pinistramenti]